MNDLWEWDPKRGGYVPKSSQWWRWDPKNGVLFPIAREGWTFDPQSRTWVEKKAAAQKGDPP